ncbi:hypothetical protein SAMN06265360_103173 [Haloechinothrix alba]|uniref:DNA-binding transcriptional regulator of glucitol operon n=1 Tax=Haloechinothrix alba TaxID=664784 RepID=A0A238VNM4_9PSEU|nr:hypothetical protein [Haloechinothrix alba]SNR35960.1 hypothetical protein SAMN06265360_103173 [Haloechinothrix alba]
MPVNSFSVGRRLAEVGVCVASLAASVALAWWQWEQFASAGGTLQNLGYVLQWPLFGLFPAFVCWRMRVLRKRAAGDGHGTDQVAPGDPGDALRRAPGPAVTGRQGGDAGDGGGEAGAGDGADDELAAYNRYLAELNARDNHRGRPAHPR